MAGALPVVSIGERLAGASAAGEVLFDNRAGVRRALEHLHGLGHRQIAVLRPPGSPTNDRPAELFVVAESDRLGLEVEVVTAGYELREATELAIRVLSADPRPTAVFCFSDSIAYGVYAAARELDIAVPGQLSVIGYDDHPISTLLSPPLTSFSWGSKRLIEVAVQMLLAAMEGDASVGRRVVIAPELRERGSTI
jgi:LacI family transcriptional regulator